MLLYLLPCYMTSRLYIILKGGGQDHAPYGIEKKEEKEGALFDGDRYENS